MRTTIAKAQAAYDAMTPDEPADLPESHLATIEADLLEDFNADWQAGYLAGEVESRGCNPVSPEQITLLSNQLSAIVKEWLGENVK